MPNYGYIPLREEDTLTASSDTVINQVDPYDYSSTDKTLSNYNRINESEISVTCSQRSSTLGRIKNINTSMFLLDDNDIPVRTDLRKLGVLPKMLDQGTCGSCYAVAAMYLYTTHLMRDLPYYLQQEGFNQTWNLSTYDAKLSVQYILNRTFGVNQYCSGGNFEYVASDMAYSRINTIELQKNFPYTAMYDKDDIIYTSAPMVRNNVVNPILKPIHYLAFDPSKQYCPMSTFIITTNSTGVFTDTQIKTIKSILARGIAVTGQMHTEGSTSNKNQAFQSYSGGIFEADCQKNSSNHQINIIGYGKYKGEDVWVFSNSWGTSWGIRGTFMTKIGSNAMCTEMYVSIQLNRYYGYDDDSLKPFVSSSAYQSYFSNKTGNTRETGKYYYDINSIYIRDGINGLDFEDGTYSQVGNNYFFIIILVLLSIGICVILYFMSVWLCCPPQNLIKPTVYIRFNAESAQKYNWINAQQYPRREKA